MSANHRATPAREWEGIRQKAFAGATVRTVRQGEWRCTTRSFSTAGTNAQSNLLVLCRGCHIERTGQCAVRGSAGMAGALLGEVRG